MTKALVLRDGRADLRIRDKRGLLPAQVKFLKELAETHDQREAASKAGLPWKRVRSWLKNDQAFQTEFDEITSGIMEAFKREVQTFADAAQDEAWELLQAAKPIPTACPNCGHRFQVEVRDTAVRARLVEMAMKMAGRLRDVRQHRVEGEVTHLTAGQKLALTALRMGKDISVQMLEQLRQLGVVPEDYQMGETGEVKHPGISNVIDIEEE